MLTGKVALVTGASSGIGAAIAEKLVDEGLKVVGVARGVDRLEEVAKNISNRKGTFYPRQCDISKEDDILKTFQWIKENVGSISIAINNAGRFIMDNISECPTQDWRDLLEVDVLAICIINREAIKEFKESNIAGHILNINSIAGHKVDKCPKLNLYPACKHAVTALTETLRLELATQESKIRVTSISPGVVGTDMTMKFMSEVELATDDLESLRARRLLDTSDVADAVWYALSRPKHVNITEMIVQPVAEPY